MPPVDITVHPGRGPTGESRRRPWGWRREVVLNNQTVIDKGQQYVMNTYRRTPVALVKAGSRVWDTEGKQYLDFMAGSPSVPWAMPPELTAVLREQGEKLWHCSNIYWNVPRWNWRRNSAGPQAWIRPSLPTAGRRPAKEPSSWPQVLPASGAQPLPDYRFSELIPRANHRRPGSYRTDQVPRRI